ncbi:hypothetical protein [Mesorhizobium sp. J428]|uniref:hypothetical protein n=1 Tax=Mesorhizobium sp. J428 TaxID=2898440 RepID=UPI002150C95B|nr:hypothetical protein [Mesorhizobium sp. J428]MCR5860465.1 hypothetical protein [Mesorhizobium sp. J428]
MLAGVAVRDDVDRSELPRFGDDPGFGRRHLPGQRPLQQLPAESAGIADPVTRRLAKEYDRPAAHSCAGYRAPCGATSAIRLLRYVQHFAAFLRARTGAVDLSRIDQALLDAYLVHARTAGGGRRTRR